MLGFRLPRCFENGHPEGSKIDPRGSKMSLPGVQNAQGGHQGRSETVAGRLLGLSRRLRGPSSPQRRPESLREAILGATFAMHAREPRKSSKNLCIFRASLCVVFSCCCAALWHRRCQRELWKITKINKFLQCNLLLRVFRAPCENKNTEPRTYKKLV